MDFANTIRDNVEASSKLHTSLKLLGLAVDNLEDVLSMPNWENLFCPSVIKDLRQLESSLSAQVRSNLKFASEVDKEIQALIKRRSGDH